LVALGNFLFHHRNKLFPVVYLLLFVPSPPITSRAALVMALGFAVAAVGQAIRIGTIGLKYIIRGGRGRRVYAEDLVTEGIFAHCRNPLYAGNILIVAGLGLMSNSLLFNALATPLFIFMYIAIVRAEEAFLRGKFGAAYDAYAEDVNRWWPRLSGLAETFGSMEFNWRQVLIREYTTTYIWLSAAVLLVMTNLAADPNAGFFEAYWGWGVGLLAALLVAYVTVRTLKIRRVITA
jgi:protein-S-isoprenylcysteine O-methyltransferase Ste14